MTSPVLYLFDDAAARGFDPFASVRPVGELLFGMFTARQRAEIVFRSPCAGHLAGDGLVGFDEADAAPALPADARAPANWRTLLNSRFVPDPTAALPSFGSESVVLLSGGQVAGWLAAPGDVVPEAALRATDGLDGLPDGAPRHELPGRWIESVWELMAENAAQVTTDVLERHHGDAAPSLPPGVHRIGTGVLSVAPDVQIEPGVVLDTASGPIRLEAGVRVQAFTRLAGPAWIGPGTTILGGSVSGVSIGPRCKVRGEIEETVVLGYTNKAHDGFLGHAVLGRWVNLGAGTTNSDLKNNYGTVRLTRADGMVDTGLTKVGCFLGDHVKTGIGTLLNTGTVIGAGSNVFGGVMPPNRVPPFRWGAGADLVPYRLDRFLEVAETVMERRDVTLTPGLRRVLEMAWEAAQEDPA